MNYYFVDTNIFLQCKDLREITWKEAEINDKSITLIISRPVQEEIDKHKNDSNRRRSTRARKANSILRKMIFNNGELKLNENETEIIIMFSPTYKTEDLKLNYSDLDIELNDDRIIAEALMFKSGTPDSKVFLLTNDTVPMLTAQRNGLDFVEIPDSWLLPPEKDNKDIIIDELQNKIKMLEKSYPEIKSELYFKDKVIDPKTDMIVLDINEYTQITSEFIKNKLNKIIDMHKKNTDFSESSENNIKLKTLGLFKNYYPPSDNLINTYYEDYDNWKVKLENWLLNYYKVSNNINNFFTLTFNLFNIGCVPANHLMIEFAAKGGLRFASPDNDENIIKLRNELLNPPEVPLAPRGNYKDARNTLVEEFQNIARFRDTFLDNYGVYPPIMNFRTPNNISRERNSFYWKNRPNDFSYIWVFECDEFMHKNEPENFELNLHVNDFNLIKSTLSIKIFANNLPEPVNKYYKINFNKTIVSVENDIDTILTQKY